MSAPLSKQALEHRRLSKMHLTCIFSTKGNCSIRCIIMQDQRICV